MTNVPISICGLTFFPENLNGQVAKNMFPDASCDQNAVVPESENVPAMQAATSAPQPLFPKGGKFLKLMRRFPFGHLWEQSLQDQSERKDTSEQVFSDGEAVYPMVQREQIEDVCTLISIAS